MSTISTFRYFSSTTTTAARTQDTGTGPSQGGVLSHTVANRKSNTYYYGVESATFTPSNGKVNASGAYTTSRQVCFTGATITQSSLGTTYGKTTLSSNTNTGSIKAYGSTAKYTNLPWESSGKTASTVLYSSSVGATASSQKKTISSSCITCR